MTYARIPGTMDDGWKRAGFDCGLEEEAKAALRATEKAGLDVIVDTEDYFGTSSDDDE